LGGVVSARLVWLNPVSPDSVYFCNVCMCKEVWASAGLQGM